MQQRHLDPSLQLCASVEEGLQCCDVHLIREHLPIASVNSRVEYRKEDATKAQTKRLARTNLDHTVHQILLRDCIFAVGDLFQHAATHNIIGSMSGWTALTVATQCSCTFLWLHLQAEITSPGTCPPEHTPCEYCSDCSAEPYVRDMLVRI